MLSPPRLVLVRPRNADNLVAISRAMKSFGLSDWVAVSSPVHLQGMREVLEHHRAPEDAGDLLRTLRRVDTLAEAIADCSWVVGTTMRVLEGRPRLTPRELARAPRPDTTWALVFGAECNGLQNEDVEQCHAVSFIPSSEAQPSLNLAQAVVVYAHELATARRTPAHPPSPALADDAALRELRASVISGLVAAGLLRNETANRLDVEALMSPLLRGSLTAREASQWAAAWRARNRG